MISLYESLKRRLCGVKVMLILTVCWLVFGMAVLVIIVFSITTIAIITVSFPSWRVTLQAAASRSSETVSKFLAYPKIVGAFSC